MNPSLSSSSSAASSARGQQDNAVTFGKTVNYGGLGGNGLNPWVIALGVAALVALVFAFRSKRSKG